MLGLLYSLMLAGCSQSGASMMGSVGSIKKQSNYEKCCNWIKDILHRIGVSYPIIVEYKIVSDQLKREHTCKYKQDCGLDKHQWEIEKKNQDKHQGIWNCVANIINKEYRKQVNRLVVFALNKNILAYMGSLADPYSVYFSLGIRFNLLDTIYNISEKKYLGYRDFIATILHEFAHFWIDSEQKKHFRNRGCYFTYANSGLYLAQYALFPTEPLMLNEFKDLPSNKAIRGCPKDKLSQTKKNLLKKGAFFTKYASTNPLEDSAETFVYFVLANAPPKPGVSEANDKVLLFYKDKKMVKIRQSIRNNFKRLGIYPNMTADEIKKLLTRLQTYNPN